MEPSMESPVESSDFSNTEKENELPQKLGKLQRFRRHPSTYKIRLEYAVFLVNFAMNLSSTIFQDQALYQTCTVVYNYNSTLCKKLGTSAVNSDQQLKSIEDQTQAYTSKIFMTESLVQAIIPALSALFIGAWTDKFGRKPVILVTCGGYLCFFLIKMIIATISLKQDVNPWIYIVASIPVSLSGGNCCLLSAIYCCVADMTNFYERPYKMCMMSGFIAFGQFIGQLVSSYLYDASNASVVFGVSAASQLVSIIFIVFIVEESVKKEQLSHEPKIRGFFDWQLIVDMIKTVTKKRPHFERSTIWCIVVPLAVITFVSNGTGNVFFLFLRALFGWTVQTYTTYSAIQTVVYFLGAIAGIIILQFILGWKQTTMIIIAYGSLVISYFINGLAQVDWLLYLAIGITFMGGIAAPMGQSVLSNTVSVCDIGKVFALMTTLETIAPLIASPLYTAVYTATLKQYPGAFNLISAGLFVLCLLATIFVHIVEQYHPNVNRPKV